MNFKGDRDSLELAFDEIIKFNCLANEFNYMQAFYNKLTSKNLEPGRTEMTVKGWENVFELHSKSGKLDVTAVEKMLLDVGIKATNSEA